ncbi:hypothetical protein OG394_10435 [Kribbella sp. NBC_01245]|nr:hypothetical protein [Kribbella sp. NBC_01245]
MSDRRTTAGALGVDVVAQATLGRGALDIRSRLLPRVWHCSGGRPVPG